MTRWCACAVALTATLAALPIRAQADAVLRLACQGTASVSLPAPEQFPISATIIVNFTSRTVEGISGIEEARITDMNDVTVTFSGSSPNHFVTNYYITGQFVSESVNGTIDRVTGDVEETWTITHAKTGKILVSVLSALKCRPT